MHQITIFYEENKEKPLPHILQIFVGLTIIKMTDAVDLVPLFRAGNDLLFEVPGDLLNEIETHLKSLEVVYQVKQL